MRDEREVEVLEFYEQGALRRAPSSSNSLERVKAAASEAVKPRNIQQKSVYRK